MSLSKVFKKTNAFQADHFIHSQESRLDWRTSDLLHKTQESAFQPESPITEVVAKKDAPQRRAQDRNKESMRAGQSSTSAHRTQDTDNSFTDDALDTPNEVDLSRYILKEEAEAKVRNAQSLAQKQGYKKGYAQGRTDAEQLGPKGPSLGFEEATRALNTIFEQLVTYRDTIIENAAEEAKDLALSLAEKIIRFSVSKQDETIVLTVEEALQQAISAKEFTIYINPDDFAVIEAHAEDLIASFSGLNNLVLKKDINVERGGVLVESDTCIVDASIASQFEVLYQAVKGR